MKKTTAAGLFILFASLNAPAQTKISQQKTAPAKALPKAESESRAGDSVVLLSSSSSAAFALAPPTRFTISDTTIKTFNARAAGADIRLSGSGIAGMPKGSYGFANGHLFLRSTAAASSGTAYGSGAVGTGTSIQGVGTGEAAIGVNGKSPYAGSGMWGSRQPVSASPQKTQAAKKE